MGCDIHSHAVDIDGNRLEGKWADGESANPDKGYMKGWGEGEPFGNRNYSVFAFLAGVRNYSGVKPISEPRGLPEDQYPFDEDEWPFGDHSFSWLSVAELEAFDYNGMMEDRRYTGRHHMGFISGALTAKEGEGEKMTWKDFLGTDFFRDLAELRRIGADRVVFGFDN